MMSGNMGRGHDPPCSTLLDFMGKKGVYTSNKGERPCPATITIIMTIMKIIQ
jgi:hypothetical protein